MSVPKQYQIRGDGSNAIVASIERGVATSALLPGTHVPTVRALAQRLKLSHGTVAAAYRTLQARGVLVSDGRRGTVVRPEPPVARAWQPEAVPDDVRDCSDGNPDPALLPPLAPGLARVSTTPVLYGADPYNRELLALAAANFSRDRIDARAIAVVHGALDGLERVMTIALRPGDRVAIEDPAYPAHVNLCAALGLRIEPVAMDARGMLPAVLGAALARGVRAVVLSPRAQNPSGAAFDAQRARELRELLAAHEQTLVLEDDHAALVAGAPYYTLCGVTSAWLVVRSLSKAFGPDLRVGVACGDEATIARLRGRQQLGTGWVSHVMQTIAATLWSDPVVLERIASARDAYRARRDALVAALADYNLASPSSSGLNVWVAVRDENTALAHVRSSGYVAAAGARFRIDTPAALRITIARLPIEDAPHVARAIARSHQTGPAIRTT